MNNDYSLGEISAQACLKSNLGPYLLRNVNAFLTKSFRVLTTIYTILRSKRKTSFSLTRVNQKTSFTIILPRFLQI